MDQRVTASLAILKVNWDKGHDYIANFVPFVAECAKRAPQAEVSLPQVQALMVEHFGLRVPQGALQTILRRAARRGYLRREHGIYVRVDAAIDALEFERTSADTVRRHEALVTRLISYCADRYKINWSQDQASSALLGYIQDYARPVLAAAIDGHPIPPPAQSVKHAMFLVNSLAMHLYRSDPAGFEFLETIVKGSMLANALLFSDLAGIAQQFKKVDVYFDTRFLLRALGLGGESVQKACTELLGILYQENVNLRVFQHTVDEMHRVLDSSARALRSGRGLRRGYGETLDYFLDARHTASDVELIIGKLPRLLHELRIEVVAKPVHSVPLGLNENSLEEALQQDVGYRSDEARRHDVDSLTAIHRLRGGRIQTQIEYCGALFITTNVALARAATRFFRQEYEGITVPLALGDYVMATIAWLKTPIAMPEFPRHQLIGNCFAAMRPTDGLWKAYLEEIGRLQERGRITADDYHLLRFSTQARGALMDLTFGTVEAFSDGTVAEVLEVAKAAARAETETALREETSKRLAAETAAAMERDQADLRKTTQLSRIRWVASRISRSTAIACLFLALALVAWASYMTLPAPIPMPPGEWWKLLAPLLLISVWLLGVANLVFGTTVAAMVRGLEVALRGAIERLLRRLIDE